MSRATSAQLRARIRTGAALLALSAGTAACGKMGDLERPGPMFGHPTAQPPSAERQDPNRPVQTVDPRDPNYLPGGQRQAPPASTAPAPQP